ncbi:MAG: biosynthetic-type acetolactate synthase large subunit [Kiritimatiellae bacterium]|nr:biosynthetic-type acetolactate synthase large subunit [Kiritimatiellia bacterium]
MQSTEPERTGAQSLVDGLEAAGVQVMFGYPGGMVLDIFNLLPASSIQFVLSRHEQGAVHMADGYARATGRTGCCLVTSGPGATNTVTGLATAFMDGVPIVCISGQVPTHMIGNDAFQEADITGITRPITKHNYLVRKVDDLPRVVAEAFYIASSGKPGPVLIDIPKDVQRQLTRVQPMKPADVSLRSYQPVVPVDPEQIARLAAAIKIAQRPLLYVGGGVIAAGASEELRELAHRTQIPVTATLMGLGAFPEDDPLCLRMLGMHGSVAANRAVAKCDLLVSVGARFDDRITGKLSEFAPLAKIAHIDIDRSAIGKSVRTDYPVLADVKQALQALLPLVGPGKHKAWLDEVQGWSRECPFSYDMPPGSLPAQYVIAQIDKIGKGEAIIVTDVGQHQMWAAQHIRHARPRSFITSGGLGTMGYGLPAAIGAQLACPDRLVVCISGDGSIQMNFQELVVAVEHELPVKVVILNNGHLGMVRQWQQMFYQKNYSAVVLGQRNRPANERIRGVSDEYLPDFVKLAEAHGAGASRVRRAEEVPDALRECFASPRPWVLECRVTEEENVFPMVPPGGSVEQMIQRLA